MNRTGEEKRVLRSYFVDEAGDGGRNRHSGGCGTTLWCGLDGGKLKIMCASARGWSLAENPLPS